jgi:hypothetical protein
MPDVKIYQPWKGARIGQVCFETGPDGRLSGAYRITQILPYAIVVKKTTPKEVRGKTEFYD